MLKTYPKNHVLISANDACAHVYILLKGRLQAIEERTDGERYRSRSCRPWTSSETTSCSTRLPRADDHADHAGAVPLPGDPGRGLPKLDSHRRGRALHPHPDAHPGDVGPDPLGPAEPVSGQPDPTAKSSGTTSAGKQPGVFPL